MMAKTADRAMLSHLVDALDRILEDSLGLGDPEFHEIEDQLYEAIVHVQEENLTKRPVSVRERKEVQDLLLREGIRVGRGRGWNGWQVHSHDRGSQGGLSASP